MFKPSAQSLLPPPVTFHLAILHFTRDHGYEIGINSIQFLIMFNYLPALITRIQLVFGQIVFDFFSLIILPFPFCLQSLACSDFVCAIEIFPFLTFVSLKPIEIYPNRGLRSITSDCILKRGDFSRIKPNQT